MIEALTERMQRSATGFACVYEGLLDVRTVADTGRAAAIRGMMMRNVLVIPCPDEACDCAVKAAETFGLRIVPVTIEVTP